MRSYWSFAFVAAAAVWAGCTDLKPDDPGSTTNPASEAGRDAGGSGGSAGAAGASGSAGSPGSAGKSGGAGESGAAGSESGAGAGGEGGEGGEGGTAGEGDVNCKVQRFYRDQDGDGFGTEADAMDACEAPDGYVVAAGDCDDGCTACNPEGQETCDGFDNNCDGQVDENTDEKCGLLEGICEEGVKRCEEGVLSDCEGGVEPGTEACDGKLDEDCDGTVDELCACSGSGSTACGETRGECSAGQQACVSGVLGECMGAVGPTAEVCDNKDNDCDDKIDEGIATRSCGSSTGSCELGTERCVSGGWVCEGGVNPVAEVCDNKDNDCDGPIDEKVGSTWYRDSDGDGYGAAGIAMIACTKPSGYVADNTDCNDSVAAVKPGAADNTCDNTDNDCDQKIDEGGGSTWYRDNDGDGYGNAASTTKACTKPSGYVADATDCNDQVGTIKPGGNDANCDGNDNDCDNKVDEAGGTLWYRDADNDGYGVASNSQRACSKPSGYVAQSGDCDDGSNANFPGATERCDTKDNDCDGTNNEGNVCCGNGVKDSGEACDTGINGWTCSDSCTTISGRSSTAYQKCFEDGAPSICQTASPWNEVCGSPGGNGQNLQCLPWDFGEGCRDDARYTIGRAPNSPQCWLTCTTNANCPDHMKCISSGAGSDNAPPLICVPK